MTREEEITQFAKSETTLCKRISNDYGSTLEEGIIIGAKWADKTMIDKACKWLEQQLFIRYDSDAVTRFINNFRKAMEE